MTINNVAPPPLQVPPDFVLDKTKGAFFSALVNTLYQLWTSVYNLRSTSRVETTDATPTGLVRIPVPLDRTLMIEARVVGRRTGGSGGAEGDSAWYVLTGAYRNVGGVLTGIGTAQLYGGEDQAAWGVAFSSSPTDAVIFVTGEANNDITWEGTYTVYEVGA